jgi:hypothetical protein
VFSSSIYCSATSTLSWSAHISAINSANMFCIECQKVLNLDVLLGSVKLYNEETGDISAEVITHHKSLADLRASAELGCGLCQLISAGVLEEGECRRLPGDNGPPPPPRRLPAEGPEIVFHFGKPDTLMFYEEKLGYDGYLAMPVHIRLFATEGM